MKLGSCLFASAIIFSSLALQAQLDKIVIPAGTPEDQALQAISNEQDGQKKLAMYEDFVQKFSSTPAAVAYGNWQISQYYDTAGDNQKALEYGEKALAAAPHNLDILVSQVNLAQRIKDRAKIMDYSVRGGEIYNSLGKQPKPDGVSDADFASQIEAQKAGAKGSYEFLEAAAYNAIADESDAKTRMSYIERFTPAFPDSRFGDGITSYAMMALGDLKDNARLVAYGEKTLAANPNHLPTLLMLAGTYVDDPKPGSTAKAVSYAQRAVAAAKADAPDADTSRKLSAGVAHSTIGYAYMKENKTAAAVPELKSAITLLKGLDDQQFAIAAYRLGFAYGKLNRFAEARQILSEGVKIQGPVQKLSEDLLTKVSGVKGRSTTAKAD
jgi:tetratricopeptide (TPR) repeat protein